jgi:ATP-dependent Lon protease
VATANNTRNIATAVMDRLEPLSMPSYSDEEKITIGRDYMLPKVLQEHGVSQDKVEIHKDVWPSLVRPLGFDAGIRTLERTIRAVARKVAKEIVEEGKDKFILTTENIKDYIPQQ